MPAGKVAEVKGEGGRHPDQRSLGIPGGPRNARFVESHDQISASVSTLRNEPFELSPPAEPPRFAFHADRRVLFLYFLELGAVLGVVLAATAAAGRTRNGSGVFLAIPVAWALAVAALQSLRPKGFRRALKESAGLYRNWSLAVGLATTSSVLRLRRQALRHFANQAVGAEDRLVVLCSVLLAAALGWLCSPSWWTVPSAGVLGLLTLAVNVELRGRRAIVRRQSRAGPSAHPPS